METREMGDRFFLDLLGSWFLVFGKSQVIDKDEERAKNQNPLKTAFPTFVGIILMKKKEIKVRESRKHAKKPFLVFVSLSLTNSLVSRKSAVSLEEESALC